MKRGDTRLAAFLLLTIFCMHGLPSILALNYADQTAAYKAWQYVINGLGVSVLLLCLGIFIRRPLVWPVLLWGIVESSEQSVCRLAKPIGGAPPSVPPFSGLCGLDFSWLGIIAALLLAVAILDERRKRDGQ